MRLYTELFFTLQNWIVPTFPQHNLATLRKILIDQIRIQDQFVSCVDGQKHCYAKEGMAMRDYLQLRNAKQKSLSKLTIKKIWYDHKAKLMVITIRRFGNAYRLAFGIKDLGKLYLAYSKPAMLDNVPYKRIVKALNYYLPRHEIEKQALQKYVKGLLHNTYNNPVPLPKQILHIVFTSQLVGNEIDINTYLRDNIPASDIKRIKLYNMRLSFIQRYRYYQAFNDYWLVKRQKIWHKQLKQWARSKAFKLART